MRKKNDIQLFCSDYPFYLWHFHVSLILHKLKILHKLVALLTTN